MGFKSIVAQKAFWKSVVYLGIGFVIIYNLVSMLFEYGGLNFDAFYQDKMANGLWIRFTIAQIISALLYGLILSYGQFRIREKKESRNK
ncbi:hypothetical protein [Salegentibacter chungangensis]|uniref:Uncharacterized protein n=1 Tax=Salegentibacter chungangensis TaxID=1335724 RepID=A0ABW3NPV8_9FLAO